MQRQKIKKGQIWEDRRTGRRGVIVGYHGNSGWIINFLRGGMSASRHLWDDTLWKYYWLVESKDESTASP